MRKLFFTEWLSVNSIVFSLFAVLTCGTAHGKAANLIQDAHIAISTSMLQRILAKEVCSCVYVDRMGQPGDSIQTRAKKCLAHSELPISPGLLQALFGDHFKSKSHGVDFEPKLLGAIIGLFQGHAACAVYQGPDRGCVLIDRPCNLSVY